MSAIENDKELLILKNSKEVYHKIILDMLKADNGNLYPLDLFLLGITKRSLSLISGFSSLLEQSNFLAATPLVRLHLDDLLHIYSMFLVDKSHDIATNFMNGKKRIKDYKDKEGNQMTDGYLCKKFFSDPNNKEFLGLEGAYKQTSKFIHFSEKHIFSAISKMEDETRMMEFIVSDTLNISGKDELEAIKCMIEITKAQFKYLIGWVETKKRK